MKKLFIILFLLTVSFRVAAQNEQTKDSTLLNRFPTEMGKEPLSPPPGTAAAPTYYPNFSWMDTYSGDSSQ